MKGGATMNDEFARIIASALASADTEARAHGAVMDDVPCGSILRIPARSGKTLTVRTTTPARYFVYGDARVEWAGFMARRVRPADTSVSFGYDQSYLVKLADLQLLTTVPTWSTVKAGSSYGANRAPGQKVGRPHHE